LLLHDPSNLEGGRKSSLGPSGSRGWIRPRARVIAGKGQPGSEPSRDRVGRGQFSWEPRAWWSRPPSGGNRGTGRGLAGNRLAVSRRPGERARGKLERFAGRARGMAWRLIEGTRPPPRFAASGGNIAVERTSGFAAGPTPRRTCFSSSWTGPAPPSEETGAGRRVRRAAKTGRPRIRPSNQASPPAPPPRVPSARPAAAGRPWRAAGPSRCGRLAGPERPHRPRGVGPAGPQTCPPLSCAPARDLLVLPRNDPGPIHVSCCLFFHRTCFGGPRSSRSLGAPGVSLPLDYLLCPGNPFVQSVGTFPGEAWTAVGGPVPTDPESSA